ncbi:hypothetical protein BTO20_14990 [Mycobacterium dioxanotrophicus]|jgi:hypothetical protein|uniref:Uncharacterized protein n=1 Tax=Mycobacterium dioxanotrophicus TaxID=482462 RepID=A0A1Y0C3M6_9MYCO|nr:hypothetical protein BTO20_14990 [Mycobacterium dioxanotrophicus]
MICPGADAAAVVVVACPVVVAVGEVDDVVLDDVEFDPHPATKATTAVATMICAFNPAHVLTFVYLSMVAARSRWTV